ncbi:AsmA family protein [Pedobacter sp.]
MSKTTFRKRKFWCWIGGILGAVILILGIAAIILSAKWKPTLTTKIKEGVNSASNGLYKIDFQDIHLNLLTGTAILDNIILLPDTNVFRQLKEAKQAPTHLFRIKVAHLKISRVGVFNAYFNKKVSLNAIVLDRPSIDMVYHKVAKKRDTIKDERTLYQQISNSLKSIAVKQIKVIDADFDYYNGKQKLNAVKHLSINVKDVLIDSAAQFDTTRVFHSKNIGFELIGYQSETKDKMYTLKLDTLRGSITGRDLEIRGFKMEPMYSKIAFSRKYRAQRDRYDLNFKKINLSGIDYVGLNNNGELHVEEIRLGPAEVNVFMNRELSPPAIDKARNFPHVALKRIPIPTVVEVLKIAKVNVAYGEYNPKTKEIGTVKLDGLNGVINNLTNDSARLVTKNYAYADLTTYVMGVAKLNVKIDFNLTANNAAFHYKGTVGGFDLKALNAIAKPLGEIEIESGKVTSASFDVSANNGGSKGVVNFYYNNLKVKMLGEDDDGKEKKKGLLSFLANTLLIKDDNMVGEKGRTATVIHERVPQASFFNLMWKTIFKGMREIVGIGVVPMKKMPEPKKK